MRINKRVSHSSIYGGYWNATICNLSKAIPFAQPKHRRLGFTYARRVLQHGFEDRSKLAG